MTHTGHILQTILDAAAFAQTLDLQACDCSLPAGNAMNLCSCTSTDGCPNIGRIHPVDSSGRTIRAEKTSDLELLEACNSCRCLVERLFSHIALSRRKRGNRTAFEALLDERVWQVLELSSSRVLISVLDTLADFSNDQAITAITLLKTEFIAQSSMQAIPEYEEDRVLGHGMRTIRRSRPDFIVKLYRRIALDMKRSPTVQLILYELLLRMRGTGKWSVCYFDQATGCEEAERALDALRPLRWMKSHPIPESITDALGSGSNVLCLGCENAEEFGFHPYSEQKRSFPVVLFLNEGLTKHVLQWSRAYSSDIVVVGWKTPGFEHVEALCEKCRLSSPTTWEDSGWKFLRADRLPE